MAGRRHLRRLSIAALIALAGCPRPPPHDRPTSHDAASATSRDAGATIDASTPAAGVLGEPVRLVEGEAGMIPGTAIRARLVRWLYGHGISDAGVYGTLVTEATLELTADGAAPITVLWPAHVEQTALGRRMTFDGDREAIYLRALPDD